MKRSLLILIALFAIQFANAQTVSFVANYTYTDYICPAGTGCSGTIEGDTGLTYSCMTAGVPYGNIGSFEFNDPIPAGAKIVGIYVELFGECTPASSTYTINGELIETIAGDFGPCNCECPETKTFSMTNPDEIPNYNYGGTNALEYDCPGNICAYYAVVTLTYCNLNLAVSVDGYTITAEMESVSYQWLDCNNNYAIIPGETNQSYTATENGDYAVEITQANCIDTSECVTISGIYINEIEFKKNISIYPNPTCGDFTIDLGNIISSVDITISDVAGQIIYEVNQNKNQKLIIPNNIFNSGIYFVKIENNKYQKVMKLIKQ